MLDDFKIKQPVAYKMLLNSKKSGKISHAYLFEANGYSETLEFALSFAKYLLCPNSHINNSEECNVCNSIDKREYLELKIIEPDGQWIKKSQLEELQIEFSKKPVIGDKKIYIINGAEKLNISSSNSILKFLEEPEEGIIAILIVDNIHHLLDTIVSRCQIISLKSDSINKTISTDEKLKQYLTVEEIEEENKTETVIDFIKYYEKNKINTILSINKLWNNYFKERIDVQNAFECILLFYKDVLNFKLNKNIEIYNDYIEDIKFVSELNDANNIINKINVIIDLKDKIKYNINLNMLMDKLLIELERCDKK